LTLQRHLTGLGRLQFFTGNQDHFLIARDTARNKTFNADPSFGNEPRFRTARLSCEFSDSTAFVVYTTRRTAGGYARNGVTRAQLRRQLSLIVGYFASQAAENACKLPSASSSVTRLVNRFEALGDCFTVLGNHELHAVLDPEHAPYGQDRYLTIYTMQVCTVARGNTASIASGKPLSPSMQAISTS
jgi:hypothetical protein